MSKAILEKYLPENAVDPCFLLIKEHCIHLKIVNPRETKYGDYKKSIDGKNVVSINATSNKYQFLITLIHEIAHSVVRSNFGYLVKPHGKEWKSVFRSLMRTFISTSIFPSSLIPVLQRHFMNPKASSATDLKLALALKEYDLKAEGDNLLLDIPQGGIFKARNGKLFQKGNKRIKRFECMEIESKRLFLFQPHAEVEYVKQTTYASK